MAGGQCRFGSEHETSCGVYLWAISVNAQEWPWCVDQTARAFGRRMWEHNSCILSLPYLSLVLVVDQTHRHAASIYADEWDDTGVLHYRGTGLRGDQRLDYEGNRWLRDAKANDTAVFVFEKGKSGRFTFRGPAELADEPYRRREPDIHGASRWVWVFP